VLLFLSKKYWLPGGEPVEINAGDFVHFPPGQTMFKVTIPVRKFFTLV